MMKDKRILVIEDDPAINKLLDRIIRKAGMRSVAAYSGTEGLLQLENNAYDLIILDLMLPGLSGEALIEKLRENSQIPIIVITAKVDIEDKVKVLKMGADDYVTKPFNHEEVLARIEVQLRRSQPQLSQTNEKIWRSLHMDLDRRTVYLENKAIHLTIAEFDILSLFVSQPEYAFSKREIYERIWTGPYVGDDNTISVHVSNIRKKLSEVTNDEYIRTIWGLGFMLV